MWEWKLGTVCSTGGDLGGGEELNFLIVTLRCTQHRRDDMVMVFFSRKDARTWRDDFAVQHLTADEVADIDRYLDLEEQKGPFGIPEQSDEETIHVNGTLGVVIQGLMELVTGKPTPPTAQLRRVKPEDVN